MKASAPSKYALLLGLLYAAPALAGAAEALCAKNPAYAPSIMLAIVREQLARDHDPSLDADTPEVLADKATAQGVAECAAEMRADPSIAPALSGLNEADQSVGWDAYNTACADHHASKGQCISAEVGAAHALKRMMASNTPPGARTLVQACALVMQTDPAMAEWRQCVDQTLAVHASEDAAKRCKLSANWHVARSGSDAGRALAACLQH
jgi:hypothetical protein